MTSAILFGSFFLLLILNTPIAVCLGVSSLAALVAGNLPLDIIPSNIYAATGKFVLMAIPFFILAGNIMEKTQISDRLIGFARAMVGHKKGGLSIVCILVSCFFAAISGSGPATVAALGMVIIPAMVRIGYKPAFAAALMAAGGAIGVVIPPSITFVVYGCIADESIAKLFMGGITPGILMGVGLVLTALWATRNEDIEILPKMSRNERMFAFKDAIWGLMMPVIILGGIYGGIFTPTEAAAVSAVYGLIIGVFVYKTLNWKVMYDILVNTAAQTGTVMLIIATSSLFAWVITVDGIANLLTNVLTNVAGGSQIIYFIILNIALLIAGCFLDATSAFYIFGPIFIPVARALGIDIVHLGIVMVVNLAIGLYTPPVGVNLYVACGLGKVSMKDISKACLPLIAVSIVVLLMVTYIPIISMWLPNLL